MKSYAKSAKGPGVEKKISKKTLEYTANARESVMRTISTSHLKAIFVEDDSVWDFWVPSTKLKIIGYLYLTLTFWMFNCKKVFEGYWKWMW